MEIFFFYRIWQQKTIHYKHKRRQTIVARHRGNTVQYPNQQYAKKLMRGSNWNFHLCSLCNVLWEKKRKSQNDNTRLWLWLQGISEDKVPAGGRLRRPSSGSSATWGCLDCPPWRVTAGCRCTAPAPQPSSPDPTTACPAWAPERWARPESAGNRVLWRCRRSPTKRRPKNQLQTFAAETKVALE